MERLNNTNMESQNSEASMNSIVRQATAEFNNGQDTVHETPTPKHSLLKTVGALATAATIGLGMTGCAEVQKIPTTITDVQPSETKPSVTTSESGTSVKIDPVGTTEVAATPTPTEAPTATPTPEVLNNEELLNKAMDIEGFAKEVQGENVVYKENGEIVAMYNPNIWVGDKQVGGLAVKEDKVEEIKVNGDIVPPFNLKEITKDTHFTIKNCKNIAVSDYTGKESNIVVMQFDTPLTFINSSIENNQFNTIDEFAAKISFEKENGEIIKIDNPIGLVPFSCLQGEATGVNNEYYVSDVVDQNTITNFDETKVYNIGETTDVIIKSTISVWKDFDNLEDTNVTDVATTKEGCVIFSYF